ncbi:MAG: hypothetical protein IPP13_03970 [Kouleothrix sp.]|jgi:hypothetical protein|nr:hypothetical protein [Kouleothrix sp.]
MTDPRDRLYQLLPAIYRVRDADQNYALRGLLRVIAEQVDRLEGDIAGLYENWFIETCDDWAVPYLGDLVGYRQVHEAGELEPLGAPAERRRNHFLIPRRDVANTLRARRRRGTLAVLEQLAADVAGWPARAVEFFGQLGRCQHLANPQPGRSQLADLRDMDALGLADGPFGRLAHTVDVRGPAARDPGRFNIGGIGLFVWRLQAYPITQGGALRIDQKKNHFSFSLLGNDMPLYTRPRPEADPATIAGALNVPIPISRRAFEHDKAAYYGEGKSLAIYRAPGQPPIPLDAIVVADLSDWQRYRPRPGSVAVDPELGRIVFSGREDPEDLKNVAVSYHYGFSAALGGGEYERPLARNTVGFALARADQLHDAPTLLLRLRDEWGPLADELRKHIDGELWRRLGDYDGRAIDADLQQRLLEYLNRVLQGDSLYSYERFPYLAEDANQPDADADTREAWRLAREEPRGARLVRLNRLLLERHFRNQLALSFRAYMVAAQPEQPGQLPSIGAAIEQWANDQPRHGVIEILDSADYTEPLVIELQAGQTLELRAGDRCRPAIRLPNQRRGGGDDVRVNAAPGSRITFDGLLITGHGLRIAGDPDAVLIRHCTLVPGWELGAYCQPQHGQQPSITMVDSRPARPQGRPTPGAVRPRTRLQIEHAIVGSIFVQRDAAGKEPLEIAISDSILDAAGAAEATAGDAADALCDTDGGTAHAVLTIARTTVIGEICTHAIDLAENSIFYGKLRVARTQRGCVRFCSLTPGSRTPRRFNCQPDMAEQAADRALRDQPGDLAGAALAAASADEQARARLRVRPQFTSTRYGTPSYCRLDATCAPEISAGADDESELGVFHDLFQPQRAANLRARLAEYAVAGMQAAVIFVE